MPDNLPNRRSPFPGDFLGHFSREGETTRSALPANLPSASFASFAVPSSRKTKKELTAQDAKESYMLTTDHRPLTTTPRLLAQLQPWPNKRLSGEELAQELSLRQGFAVGRFDEDGQASIDRPNTTIVLDIIRNGRPPISLRQNAKMNFAQNCSN